ncbi:hypothetical protein RMR16_026685 (plasmid) [Agrobacterium sp. rho-13.3]|uniref:hypothetical protein n=1 Tax=Agrobacterium sp. rho-13.3 TaxID=3072980 RepID=UPI002A0E84E3|nr:hypothetical protein [Agrobacterium sp. rho-13.3]MDX8311541.1 hypothetical protein [Agrobacterium sp. rho-13.3]
MNHQITDEFTEQEVIPLTLAPLLVGGFSLMAIFVASAVMPATCSNPLTESCALTTTVIISALLAVVGLWACHTLRGPTLPTQ